MRSEPIFPVFFSHNINIHFLSTESNCPMITERFAVIWLAVTFHVQSLSADKCAILGNSINNLMFSEWGGGGSEGQKRKLIQNANDHSRRLKDKKEKLVEAKRKREVLAATKRAERDVRGPMLAFRGSLTPKK